MIKNDSIITFTRKIQTHSLRALHYFSSKPNDFVFSCKGMFNRYWRCDSCESRDIPLVSGKSSTLKPCTTPKAISRTRKQRHIIFGDQLGTPPKRTNQLALTNRLSHSNRNKLVRSLSFSQSSNAARDGRKRKRTLKASCKKIPTFTVDTGMYYLANGGMKMLCPLRSDRKWS